MASGRWRWLLSSFVVRRSSCTSRVACRHSRCRDVCLLVIFALRDDSCCPAFSRPISSSALVALLLAFLGAGLVYGLYSIGLAMLSKRFTGGEIIAANAGFVIIFELSNLAGPAFAGILLDINMRLGLPIFLVSVGVVYLLVSWLRRNANPDN